MGEPDDDRHSCCRVLELRQYTLQPGARDDLMTLFEHHFLDALEATGMHVPALFADLDDPDRLVWLRGFPDLETRRRALSDFYLHGSVWREHGPAANATMVDSDDVLLLETAYVGDTYPTAKAPRLTATDGPPSGGFVVDVAPLARLEEGGAAIDALVERLRAGAQAEGADVVLVAVTHPQPNDFPALPVRDEQVAVWLLHHPDPDVGERIRTRLGLEQTDEQVRLGPLTGSQIS